MGMIAQGKNQFVGKDCPVNTYGAAGKVYGWAAAPCKPCPRNMITDNATKVSNADVCVNDDGFGYASEGASRCAPGFYSAKGSRKPCQQCPVGRTTEDNPGKQRFVTECLVRPGFGVVNSTNNTDAFNPNTELPLDQLVNLPVLECPIGWFGVGGDAGSKCQQCPAGSSTRESGAANSTACDGEWHRLGGGLWRHWVCCCQCQPACTTSEGFGPGHCTIHIKCSLSQTTAHSSLHCLSRSRCRACCTGC